MLYYIFLAHKYDVNTNNNIYIGHTIETIKERWWKHKLSSNDVNSPKYLLKVYRFIRQNGGTDNLNTRFSTCYLDIDHETYSDIIEKNKIAKKNNQIIWKNIGGSKEKN